MVTVLSKKYFLKIISFVAVCFFLNVIYKKNALRLDQIELGNLFPVLILIFFSILFASIRFKNILSLQNYISIKNCMILNIKSFKIKIYIKKHAVFCEKKTSSDKNVFSKKQKINFNETIFFVLKNIPGDPQ